MVISAKKISYSIGDVNILNCVCLDVSKGEYVAIVGENGSGKTTLFKIITGELRPSNGEVLINGVKLKEFKDWYKIGYLSQQINLPNIPVTANEIIISGYTKKSKILLKDQLTSLVDILKLDKIIDNQFSSLSGGQKQRVLLARSLINRPDILFLDEPTNGLDPDVRKEILDYLNLINKEFKIAIIHITHDLEKIKDHVDRAVCITSRWSHIHNTNQLQHIHHD